LDPSNETQERAVVYSQSPEANALSLAARDYFNKSDPRIGGTLAHAREAIGLYEQAVKKDPKFALAFVELSRAWAALGYSEPDGISNKELLPHAKAAARVKRTVRRPPSLGLRQDGRESQKERLQ